MIKLENLTKVYRTDEVETTALNEISFEIDSGEFVSVMGPSGCGKSTLLNVLGLLDSPAGGSYQFLEKEAANLNEKERAQIRKKNIGFVFQNFNLIEELTVFENIELPLLYNDVPAKERKEKVDEMISKVGISNRANHYPQQLSGGQQQRVAVARALINRPALILADEPTGNLDTSNGNEIMELLCELNDAGTTIIMVTHSSHDASYSDRIINLLDGEVISEGKAKAHRVAGLGK
ncbi:MAG: ABC transporter ATP-binding protein [Bacteroidetes bacterium]|nr:ABC transporter ATP-binding protein [Bacteroidota bacterium]